MRKHCIAMSALVGIASLASGDLITVVNGDFEAQFGVAPFLGNPDSFSDNVLTDWIGATATGFNHGAVDPALGAAQPTSGDLAAYMVNNSFLEQTITHTIDPGETIVLRVDAWRNNGVNTMTVDFAGLGPQTVDLGVGSNDSVNNQITWIATAPITSGLLRFETVATGSAQARIDTVSMEVIPEPTSLTLAGLGILTFMLRRRHA